MTAWLLTGNAKRPGVVNDLAADSAALRPPEPIGARLDAPEDSRRALDLTERIKSEALRANEKRFKALFEQSAVGVARVDALSGRYLYVNQRFGEILGRSREELAQLTAADITHPHTVGRDLELVQQIKEGDVREFTVEKRYLRKDGSEVWATVTVSQMWAPDEAPDYYLAVVQDITARKNLEDQFRQAQKMEAMGTLAGGIAHDFNNILATINGYAELAQMKLQGNPAVRDYLSAVLEAGYQGAALVRQILTFSRPDQLVRAPLALGPIVAESIKMFRATVPASARVIVSLAADAPTILADPTQIHQILNNLANNAWHAMKERPGPIEIRLERCLVDAVQAATHSRLRPGLYARVSVRDTGCGMDPATLRRIFEPFFTTKPPGEGTGLGLSVVHGVMENHEGAVAVYSELGVGTVFHLYFPAQDGAVDAAGSYERPAPRGHGERILLVDDDEMLANLCRDTLVELSYEVNAVTNPAAAIALVTAEPSRYSLVITDQTMPGMTGMALANTLRQVRPSLPVILMTAGSATLTPEVLNSVGVRQILFKPCSLHTLGTAVHEALSVQLQS